jgi:hypothetical protein
LRNWNACLASESVRGLGLFVIATGVGDAAGVLLLRNSNACLASESVRGLGLFVIATGVGDAAGFSISMTASPVGWLAQPQQSAESRRN